MYEHPKITHFQTDIHVWHWMRFSTQKFSHNMICVRFYGSCLHPWDFLGGGLEMKNVDSNFSYKASCQESAGLLAIKMSSLYSAFKAFFWHNKKVNVSAKSINMYEMNVNVISSWINDRPKAKGNSEKVPFCILSESTICTNVHINIFKKFHSKSCSSILTEFKSR